MCIRDRLGTVQRAVDATEPRDHAIGGGLGYQVVHGAVAALRGDGEAAVLDVEAAVREVVDVLAGCSVPALMAFGDGFGTRRVQQGRPTVEDRLQIGTDMILSLIHI